MFTPIVLISDLSEFLMHVTLSLNEIYQFRNISQINLISFNFFAFSDIATFDKLRSHDTIDTLLDEKYLKYFL